MQSQEVKSFFGITISFVSTTLRRTSGCQMSVWLMVVTDRRFSGISTRVAAFANCLFWYYGAALHVYDLSQNELLKSPLCSLLKLGHRPDADSSEYASKCPFLVCTDKAKLCLLWPDLNNLHWLTFQIKRDPLSNFLCADRDRFGSFYVGVSDVCHVLTESQGNLDYVLPETKD